MAAIRVGSSSDFVYSYLDRSEEHLNKLMQAEKLNFREMEELVYSVSLSLAHHEKTFTRTLSQMHDKHREYNLDQAVGHMRGWKVAALTMMGSTLQMAAGVSNLAPHVMMGGVSKLHQLGGRLSPFQGFIDTYSAKPHTEVATVFSSVFGNIGQSTSGVAGIANQWQSSYQTLHHSLAENGKLNKERLTQEVQQIGSRYDDGKRKLGDGQRAHHEMLMALMRV